jgi:hypothetical protein
MLASLDTTRMSRRSSNSSSESEGNNILLKEYRSVYAFVLLLKLCNSDCSLINVNSCGMQSIYLFIKYRMLMPFSEDPARSKNLYKNSGIAVQLEMMKLRIVMLPEKERRLEKKKKLGESMMRRSSRF